MDPRPIVDALFEFHKNWMKADFVIGGYCRRNTATRASKAQRLKEVLKETDFSEEEIKKWYKKFTKENPSKQITVNEVKQILGMREQCEIILNLLMHPVVFTLYNRRDSVSYRKETRVNNLNRKVSPRKSGYLIGIFH